MNPLLVVDVILSLTTLAEKSIAAVNEIGKLTKDGKITDEELQTIINKRKELKREWDMLDPKTTFPSMMS